MRFAAIDGLRGWLAWAVVVSHAVQFCSLETSNRIGDAISNLGPLAVLVFIVISGFVICGRVIELREPWTPYIIRRFFRIFPLYWILLPLSVILLPYVADAFNALPWAGNRVRFDERIGALTDHPLAQGLFHISLLQGLIPDSLWPRSSAAILPPAWSLSLEWQYYLVAPLFVGLLAGKRTALITVFAVVVAALLFNRGYFGTFYQPSIFPMAAYMFMIGIASRLGFEKLEKVPFPSVFAVAIILFGFLFKDLRWLAIWGSVLIYLSSGRRWEDEVIGRMLDLALVSKPAVYFGERSYSTYLVHWPVMYLVLIALAPLGLSSTSAIAVFFCVSLSLTAIASHFLYRYVEQPFIRLGSRVARRQMAITA